MHMSRRRVLVISTIIAHDYGVFTESTFTYMLVSVPDSMQWPAIGPNGCIFMLICVLSKGQSLFADARKEAWRSMQCVLHL